MHLTLFSICQLCFFFMYTHGMNIDRLQDAANVTISTSLRSSSSSSLSSSSSPSIQPTLIQAVTESVVPVAAASSSSSDSQSTALSNQSKSSSSSIEASNSHSPSGTISYSTKTPTAHDLAKITGEPNWHDWNVFPWGSHPQWTGYPWGNSTIPINSCWQTAFPEREDSPWWPGCTVNAWEVQVSYFPSAKGNLTYPSTQYAPDLGITMTSPSIYLILKTVDAVNDCGRLGPTFTNRVMAMDPSAVKTLRLYENQSAKSMIGTPEVLDLNDIATDCDAQFQDQITQGPSWTSHPIASDSFNRCSPRIEWPPEIQSLGRKYWKHCGIPGTKYGLFDPPGAVPPVTGGLLPSSPAVIVPSTTPAAVIPTVPPPVSPSTSAPIATSTVAPANTPIAGPSLSSQVSPVQPPVSQGSPFPTVQPPTPTTPSPPSLVSVIAVIGSNTISVQPGSPNIILPNGSTATVGAQVTISTGTNNPVIISVGSSGILVGGGNVASTYYPNPTIAVQNEPNPQQNTVAVPVTTGSIIGTVAGNVVITAALGASSIAVGSQTLVLGGPLMTLSGDQVLSLGTNGVIVQAPSGKVQTLALPTTAPVPNGPAALIASMVGLTQVPSSVKPSETVSTHISALETVVLSPITISTTSISKVTSSISRNSSFSFSSARAPNSTSINQIVGAPGPTPKVTLSNTPTNTITNKPSSGAPRGDLKLTNIFVTWMCACVAWNLIP